MLLPKGNPFGHSPAVSLMKLVGVRKLFLCNLAGSWLDHDSISTAVFHDVFGEVMWWGIFCSVL